MPHWHCGLCRMPIYSLDVACCCLVTPDCEHQAALRRCEPLAPRDFLQIQARDRRLGLI